MPKMSGIGEKRIGATWDGDLYRCRSQPTGQRDGAGPLRDYASNFGRGAVVSEPEVRSASSWVRTPNDQLALRSPARQWAIQPGLLRRGWHAGLGADRSFFDELSSGSRLGSVFLWRALETPGSALLDRSS